MSGEDAKPPPRIDTFPLRANSNIVGEVRIVTSRFQDTLLDIAREYDLGYRDITAANPAVDVWLPGEGTQVVLPNRFILPNTPRKGIVLNLAQMRLFYYPPTPEGEAPVVVTHPVGIGRVNWSTPKGITRISDKIVSPSWRPPASIRTEHAAYGDILPVVVPPGPDNPLGTHAMRMGSTSYLIHGTNRPAGIGMRVSHGCVQLYPEDIISLFNHVPAGTEVRVVNQPYLAGWEEGALYLQAHKPLEEQAQAWGNNLEPMETAVTQAVATFGLNPNAIDWGKARRVASLARGIPVPITRSGGDIDSVLAEAPVYQLPPVQLDAHHTPQPQTAAEQPKPATPEPKPGAWYLQTGSFRIAENARRLATMLNHLGPPQIPVKSVVSEEGYYRVLAGPFRDRKEAENNAWRIKSSFGATSLILGPRI
jgi:L,D-transpeptidase ErfK/SrfK